MRRALTGLLGAVLLAGCTPPSPPSPPTSPTPSATPSRTVFTVATTERPTSLDPAAATTTADSLVALNAFSRLMTVRPEDSVLKPDLASDCLYTSALVYQCELPKELTFGNGHPLTASDVRFSIERAYRLSTPRSSAPLLNSLRRVETQGDTIITFHLRWPDSQFGYALAAPAASIVDEELYDPDSLRPNDAAPAGSGPFSVATFNDDEIVFARFKEYKGANAAVLERVRVAFVADSAAAEQAIKDASVDVVWRSLDPAGLDRITAEIRQSPNKETAAGFRAAELPDTRVRRLIWNPASPSWGNAAQRQAVARALQADRTLASIVPSIAAGGMNTFPVGGRPSAAPATGQRPRLTLSWWSRDSGQGDAARLVRDRIEDAGISVQLVPDRLEADLFLSDRTAWVNTAFGWLQPYLDHPLPGSATKLADLEQRARSTADLATRQVLLNEIQQQAAVDLTVLPVSQGPDSLLLLRGVRFPDDDSGFGPGYQLGLWGFGK